MTGTAPDQLSAWLGRFILIKVEREIKLLLLRYQAEGAVGEDIFVGREHELMRLSRPDKLGGIIFGAHSSAYELRNEMEPVAN